MGVNLRPLIIDYKQQLAWSDLSGVAAIDAFNALYQFLSCIRQSDGMPLMDDAGRVTSHLSGIMFRSANLFEKNITPVYVFDGKPPAFKEETLVERRAVREDAAIKWDNAIREGDTEAAHKYAAASSKVDAYIIESSKELLSALGIAWVQAPEEGEAQSAFMAQAGDVSFAVSQDYDSLLFGASHLVRNVTISGKRRVGGHVVSVFPERLILSDVLSSLGLSREELVECALLIGTDFNSGVAGVGPKTAVKIVREGKFWERIGEAENAADPQVLLKYFLEPPVNHEYSVVSKAPDSEKVFEILCEEHGFMRERVESGLEKFGAKRGQATLDSWF